MLYLTNVKRSLFKLDQLQEAKKMNLGVVIFHLLLLLCTHKINNL